MSLIPTIYSSYDAGAPQLSGTVGSLISLLRAVLVTGYGTAPSDKAGLGWTEEFTGTNKSVFRPGLAVSTGAYLRVDDSATVGNARYALIRAFAAMTDVDTGTEPCPTPAAVVNGALWVKSQTLDATARTWWLIGNERCFYLFVRPANLIGDESQNPYFAGDLSTLKPGDMGNFAVSVPEFTEYTGGVNQSCWLFRPNANLGLAGSTAMFLLRPHTQNPGSVAATCTRDSSDAVAWGAGKFVYPYPVNGGLLTERGHVTEAGPFFRGAMPGLHVPMHDKPFANLVELDNLSGFPAGTQLIAKSYGFYVAASTLSFCGQLLFEVSAEW